MSAVYRALCVRIVNFTIECIITRFASYVRDAQRLIQFSIPMDKRTLRTVNWRK